MYFYLYMYDVSCLTLTFFVFVGWSNESERVQLCERFVMLVRVRRL